MLTVSSKPSFSTALIAARRASAVPQLPLPMTATFSVLPVPSIGSNLARKGTMAGDEPLRGLFLTDSLRAMLGFPSASTPAAAELAEVCVRGFILSAPMALSRGDGGRDEPGVDMGEIGRLPGSDAIPESPRGDPGAVEGGESLIAEVLWSTA